MRVIGMTIGSMVKAIYDKAINSAAISGTFEVAEAAEVPGLAKLLLTISKKGSTITISSVVIPPALEKQ